MNRLMKKLILIVLVFVMSLFLPACYGKQVVERQTEYHSEIIDLERVLLNEYGDYYRIEEPQINYESKFISISCTFLTSYIIDSSKDMTLLEVMEGTRIAFNSFLENNPEYFLSSGYHILINFYELPESYACGPIKHGSMSNSITGAYGREPLLCYVEYSEITSQYIDANVSFEGIREIDLGYLFHDNVDDVIKLLNDMPDIEIVRVQPNEIQEELSQRLPDLLFV